MTNNWQVWALLSAIFAAATAILSKIGIRGVEPDTGQLVRTSVVLVTVALLSLSTGGWRDAATFTSKTWSYLIFAGLATAATWLCYFRALAVGDASRVAAVDKLSVPLVAVVAAIVLHERMGIQGWVGVALAAAGVALISYER